ncbi:hypothetical protein FBUS_02724 [Fasciolopsis buskii]|uniref:Uncharacterized protein n=1 Tax=Fasciolopsis buskii TaxID=27845 RepID=A0A8E0RN37_9TREM|nr:hypothetical protein FBUS_02724 [Fasciolopsis buski]
MNSDGTLLLRKPRCQPNDPTPRIQRTKCARAPKKQSTVKHLPELHPKPCPKPIRIRQSNHSKLCENQPNGDFVVQKPSITKLPSEIPPQFRLVSKELVISDKCEARRNFYCENEITQGKESISPVYLKLDTPYLAKRVPMYQSLIEVTREIKIALVKSRGVNLQCSVHQLPKYDPSIPLKSGPRHEIIIMELTEVKPADTGFESTG